jgi:hypothetical protein
LVTTVILIFFISPASLSTSSPAFWVGAPAEVAVAAGAVCRGAPFAAAGCFFGARGARGAGSFFGARVFFTLRLLPLAPATVVAASALLVMSALASP